jgi:hypothetical protein
MCFVRVAFHVAAMEGLTSVLEVLLRRGVPVDQRTTPNGNETTLHLAAKRGTSSALSPLVLRKTFDEFETGNYELALFLLEHGADVNASTALGSTPLMLAVESGPLTLLLLDRGANVNAQDRSVLYFTWDAKEAGEMMRRRAGTNGVDAGGGALRRSQRLAAAASRGKARSLQSSRYADTATQLLQ